MEIPDLNLFMMCRRVNREAFRGLPEGYHFRLCRREERGIWEKLNLDDPRYPDYMGQYFERVYGDRQEEFFARCTFVCDANDRPVATCFLWRAYGGRLSTLHWFKVLPELEGRGLGRALLTHLLEGLGEEDLPLFLHTHPSCFRAVGLYADFGFHLLEGPPVGGRGNDLRESLPYLQRAMPEKIFARLEIEAAPRKLLEAAELSEESEF